MANVPVPIEQIMNNPNLSISSSPFTQNMIIKRASFRGGEVPEHLEPFLFEDNHEGTGETDTEVYQGKTIPSSAAAIGEQRSGMSGRR